MKLIDFAHPKTIPHKIITYTALFVIAALELVAIIFALILVIEHKELAGNIIVVGVLLLSFFIFNFMQPRKPKSKTEKVTLSCIVAYIIKYPLVCLAMFLMFAFLFWFMYGVIDYGRHMDPDEAKIELNTGH